MTDLPANDEIVAIDGKQYSRLMAEEMARDIDYVVERGRPGAWGIHHNSALTVGAGAYLSFAMPTQHAYVVDGSGASDDVRGVIDRFQLDKRSSSNESMRWLTIPAEKLAETLPVLRAAHERAIDIALAYSQRCNVWQKHDFVHARALELIVGRELPEPSYADELRTLRASGEGQAAFTLDQFRDFLESVDSAMLDRLARDIEAADGVNPNSWALGQYGAKELRLYVSKQIGLQLTVGQCLFVLSGRPDDPRLKVLRPDISEERAVGPEAFIFEVALDEANSLLDEFDEQHTLAIESLAGSVKRHLPWARNHNQDLVEVLAQVVGRELPQPAYLAAMGVAPDAPPPDAATNVPDIVDPSPQAAAQMARTILAAHALSPDCWAVYSTNKRIALMVGNVVAGGSAAAGKYDFVVHRSQLDDAVVADLDAMQVPKIPKQYAALSFPRLPDDTSDERFVELQTAHASALAVISNPYRRAVVWQNHQEALRKRLEAISGIDLPEPSYLTQIPGKSPSAADVSGLVPLAPLPTIRDQFATSGLHYTEAQLATFYTALQTKGFVVLSGISGTGKSKIATGFVEMLPAPDITAADLLDDEELITLTIKPYMRKYHNATLPARQAINLPLLELGESVPIKLAFGSIQGTGKLKKEQPAGITTVLYFHGTIGKAIEALDVDTPLYLRFHVDEEADKVVRADILTSDMLPLNTSQSTSTKPQRNNLFLSVRPDWRDSTSLLGYYNPLTQTYEWTDFLRFLIRAGDDFRSEAPIAWFVILDEMNLAHVEYYFADLLSVIESGRDDEGWTREPLRMTYPDTLEDEAPPRELHLPPNLYLIGTVNMDETTHAFSPKVLDRAFTIELADVDFTNYPIDGAGSGAGELTEDEKLALLRAFTRDGCFALIDKGEIGAVVVRHERIRQDLQALNDLLRQNRMHFGYRVFDEICQYLHNNDVNQMMDFEDAFDGAVFMKVLPKFTGSKARLQSPLRKVLAWAIDPGATISTDVDAVTQQFIAYEMGADDSWNWPLDAAFPLVAARVRDMLVAVERDGFVSFG